MPLKRARSKSKRAVNAAVSSNIHELEHHGTRPRSHEQIIAIAEAAARRKHGSKRSR